MFNFFKQNKRDTKSTHYFGLTLKENEGKGCIMELDNQTHSVRIIDEKKFIYSNSWEQLVEDVDQVLYDLEQHNNIHVKKVIFFLYSHLIDQQSKQIKKNYALRIKKIADELTIEPMGFIEYHEAIFLYQTREDQAPLTSIIVELDSKVLSVFIYKAGELFFADSIGKTDDIVSDLESVFSKIKKAVLPARIILYDSTNLADESHKIITHKFSDELFIQLPKVEVLSEEQINDALLYGFSKQFFDDKAAPQPFHLKQSAPKTTQVNNETVTTDPETGTMGFVIGGDIKDTITTIQEPQSQSVWKHTAEMPESNTAFDETISQPNMVQNIVSSMRSMFSRPTIFSANQTSKKPYIFITLIIAILLVSFVAVYLLFLNKATLTLYFEAQKDEKEMTIDVNFSGSAANSNQIVAHTVKKSISETDTVTTTGKKTIGQKATGSVTIYNKDTADKQFKKGDMLTSSSGVKFTFDTDVKVASASESMTSEGNVLTVTGKAKGQVTAGDIGPTGNLAKGDKLFIGEYSQNLFFALVDTSFSGGSKQDVNTVSKDDIANIDTDILAKLKQAKDATPSSDTTTEDRQIPQLADITITDKKYSHEVGEQADSVAVQAKGSAVQYVYNESALLQLIAANLKNTVSGEYDLPVSNITYSIRDAKKNTDKTASMQLTVMAHLVKKSDLEAIKSAVIGKNESAVGSYVQNSLHAKGYSMSVATPLPLLRSRMPFFKQNIQIVINSL